MAMAQSPSSVPDFSKRLSLLLDKANFPSQNRFSEGARRYGTTPSTFRSWCLEDRPPREFSLLQRIVHDQCEQIGGNISPVAVIGWLYAGDAVANPFENEESNFLEKLKAGNVLQQASQNVGVDFDSLDEEQVKSLIMGIQAEVRRRNLSIRSPEITKFAEYSLSTL